MKGKEGKKEKARRAKMEEKEEGKRKKEHLTYTHTAVKVKRNLR